MHDPTQLAVLVLIVVSFVTFGVVLFAVSLYVTLSAAAAQPVPRRVVQARPAGVHALH